MSEPGKQETNHANLAKHVFDVYVRGQSERIKELDKENLIDPVTGLRNFRALNRWLEEDKIRQDNKKLGLPDKRKTGELYPTFGVAIFIDVDGLRKANDISHEYGDLFLKTVAEAIKAIANRPLDKAFRRGDRSDEFVIILPGENREAYESLETKFNSALDEARGSNNFFASMVFAEYGLDSRSAREVLQESDRKLSEAKAQRPKGEHVSTIYLTE